MQLLTYNIVKHIFLNLILYRKKILKSVNQFIQQYKLVLNLNDGLSNSQECFTDGLLELTYWWVHNQLTTSTKAQRCLEDTVLMTNFPLKTKENHESNCYDYNFYFIFLNKLWIMHALSNVEMVLHSNSMAFC